MEAWLSQQRAVRLAPEGQRSGIREAYLREGRAAYTAAVGARMNSALQTPTPFIERLVHFWSNHFAVSVDKLLIIGLAGAFEADAIRPNVLGRFEDLLLAAASHPAMLLYLDQAQSSGPGSLVGLRSIDRQQRPRGLNENLAREILDKRGKNLLKMIFCLASPITIPWSKAWSVGLICAHRRSMNNCVPLRHTPKRLAYVTSCKTSRMINSCSGLNSCVVSVASRHST